MEVTRAWFRWQVSVSKARAIIVLAEVENADQVCSVKLSAVIIESCSTSCTFSALMRKLVHHGSQQLLSISTSKE